MKSLLQNKVKKIESIGKDAAGRPATDYNEWIDVFPEKNELVKTTRNGQNVGKEMLRFDASNKLINMETMEDGINSSTTYSYNEKQQLIKVATLSKDPINGLDIEDVLIWEYKDTDLPIGLLKISNKTDTLHYLFVIENNKVVEEQLLRGKQVRDRIYYYYNESNRISDIVRYNKYVKKLMPDIMLEYNESNQVIQKVTLLTLQRSADYLIWRFVYNEKGLKTKEALFNKNKELQGKIDYTYTFY